MKYARVLEIPDQLLVDENKLASESVLTVEEINSLLEKREKPRNRHWTKAERLARLTIMKWSV